MLHYNTPPEQKRIIGELASGTKLKGLVTIIQPTPTSRSDQGEINGLYNLLCSLKGSNKKYWLTLPEIIRMVEESGLQLQEVKSLEGGSYTINGFYKERYALSGGEIKKVQTYLAGEEGIYMPTRVISALRR